MNLKNIYTIPYRPCVQRGSCVVLFFLITLSANALSQTDTTLKQRTPRTDTLLKRIAPEISFRTQYRYTQPSKDHYQNTHAMRSTIGANLFAGPLPLRTELEHVQEIGPYGFHYTRFRVSLDKGRFLSRVAEDLEKQVAEKLKAEEDKINNLVSVKKLEDSLAFVVVQKQMELEDYARKQKDSAMSRLPEPDTSGIPALREKVDSLSRMREQIQSGIRMEQVDSLRRLYEQLKNPEPGQLLPSRGIAEKFLGGINRFDIGTVAPSYGRLLMQGAVVQGASVEGNAGNFYYAALGGRSQQQQFSLRPQQLFAGSGFQPDFYLVRAGWGKPAGNYIILSLLDKSYRPGEDPGAFAAMRYRTPLKNRVYHLDVRRQLHKSLAAGAEYAVSEGAYILSGNKEPEYLLTTGTLPPNHAFHAHLDYESKNTRAGLEGGRTGSSFFSAGAPYTRTDLAYYKGTFRTKFWKNKLTLKSQALYQHDNQGGSKAGTTQLFRVQNTLTLKEKKLPVISLAHSAVRTAVQYKEQGLTSASAVDRVGLTLTHTIRKKTWQSTSVGSAAYQQIRSVSMITHSGQYAVSQVLLLDSKWELNTMLTLVSQKNAVLKQHIFQSDVSASRCIEKSRIGLGAQYTVDPNYTRDLFIPYLKAQHVFKRGASLSTEIRYLTGLQQYLQGQVQIAYHLHYEK